MAKKKSTSAERRQFIEEERALDENYKGPGRRLHMNTGFIDRHGNVIRPNKADYQAAIAKRDRYNARRSGEHYQTPSEAEKDRLEVIKFHKKYHESQTRAYARAARRYQAVIATLGFLGAIFFLSSNITGNAIGNLTNSTSNILGAVLLVVGLIGGFFWLRSGKK